MGEIRDARNESWVLMENAMELEQRLTLVRDLIDELEQAMRPGPRLRIPFLKRWALVRDPIDAAYWQRRVLLLLDLDLPVSKAESEQPQNVLTPGEASGMAQTMKLNLQDLKAQAQQQPWMPQEDLLQTMKLNLQDLKAQAQQQSWMPQEDLLQTMKLNLQELEKQAEQRAWMPQENLLQTMKLDLQELKSQAERHDNDFGSHSVDEDLLRTMELDLKELMRQARQHP